MDNDKIDDAKMYTYFAGNMPTPMPTPTKTRARCSSNGACPHLLPRRGGLLPPLPPSVPRDRPPLAPRPPGGELDGGDDNEDPAIFAALATSSMTATLPLLTPHPDLDGRTTYSDGGHRSLPPALTLLPLS